MGVEAKSQPSEPPKALTERTAHVQLNALNTIVIPHDLKDEAADSWFCDVNDPVNQPTPAIRTGNEVVYFVDGKETFKQYQREIQGTNGSDDFIYIAGWVLFLDFSLPGEFDIVMPEGTNLKLGWTMRDLLKAASERNVQIRVMLPKNADTKECFGNRFGGGENLSATSWVSRLGTGAGILDGRTRLEGTHHQKILIVKHGDQLSAFCGGIDINPDRISDKGQGILHDVHCRIRGPAARDLLTVFCDRWQDYVNNINNQDDEQRWLKSAPPLVGLQAPQPAARGSLKVQICRTCANPPTFSYDFAPKGERAIKALIARAIEASKRFIYIEDQYLVDMETAGLLRKRLGQLKHVTILIPPGPLLDLPEGVYRRKQFIEEVSRGGADKVRVYCLDKKSTTCGTYVHAKTWIFDDKFAIIGSANCNRRGYTHDSEVAAGIFDASNNDELTYTFAHRLRMKLWAHHLGLDDPDDPEGKGYAELADGVASADNWAGCKITLSRNWYPVDKWLEEGARVVECDLNENISKVNTDFDWDHAYDPDGS